MTDLPAEFRKHSDELPLPYEVKVTLLDAAARIEQLEKEIKTAIRQFEDDNRLECHRTLCTVIYGKQY